MQHRVGRQRPATAAPTLRTARIAATPAPQWRGVTEEAAVTVTPTAVPSGTVIGMGRITAGGVNFRETEGGGVIEKLERDTLVEVLTVPSVIDTTHWYQVRYNNRTGYVQAPFVQLLGANVTATPTPAQTAPAVGGLYQADYELRQPAGNPRRQGEGAVGSHGRGAAHRGLRSEEERLYLVSDLLQRQHPLCARRLRAGGVLAGRQLRGNSDAGCVSCALRLCPHDEGERESAASARRGYLPTGGQEPRGALHEQHRGGWLRLVLRAGGQRARLCTRRLRAGVQCGWQRSGDGGPRRGEYARNGDGDACNDGLRLCAAGGG